MINSHPTRWENAWKFIKTLHVKFFPFGEKSPARRVTVKVVRVFPMVADHRYDTPHFTKNDSDLKTYWCCITLTLANISKWPDLYCSIISATSNGSRQSLNFWRTVKNFSFWIKRFAREKRLIKIFNTSYLNSALGQSIIWKPT